MFTYIKTKIKKYTNRLKECIKSLIDRFLKSKFLVFTLGITIGITYTYIYLTAPQLFQPCIKTIWINNRASAEVVSGNLGGTVKASPLVKSSDLSRDSIKGLVAHYFGTDAPTALKIMKCESRFKKSCGELNNPDCINTTNGSNDRGYWQISKKYHPEVSDECAFDLNCATKQAHRIYEKRGWGEWACAKLIK